MKTIKHISLWVVVATCMVAFCGALSGFSFWYESSGCF